ncbi:MAG: ABC transporter ATP-binding protein/permease [Actinomycetota bacterium]|nr:ABC transporter ATP-binding protein/permease [Actinomycetota bacterium]
MIRFVRRTFSIIDQGARRRFVLFALGSVAVAALEALGVALIVPLTRLLVDGAQGDAGDDLGFLPRLLDVQSAEKAAAILGVLVLVTFTVKGVCAIGLLRWGVGNALRQEARIARRLFTGYLLAPAAFHLKRNSSEIQRTLNESMVLVFRRALPFVMSASADAFSLVAVAVVIVLNDPAIALVGIVYFVLVGFVYQRFIGGRQKVAAKRAHQEVAERYRQVQEALGATKELNVLHREDYFIKQFYDTKLELVAAQRVLIFYQLMPRHFLDLAFIFGAAVMAAYAFATLSTVAALSIVGLFLTATFRLVAPLNRIMATFTLARTAEPALEQVITDLHLVDGLRHQRTDASSGPLGPCPLELREVCFRYEDTDRDVLDDISLRVEPGDDVGIVGTSGAGKTTLLDVMLGLLDPRAGEVLIDGEPLSRRRTDWQLSIGYVPQEIVLVDDTMRANIAFGIAPDAVNERRLGDALAAAQLDAFVASLPDGLDTVVGERGVRLSGGQRQRIGLARALYHQPIVLVLDEATSALDSDTESRIMETIAALRRSLTIISVSHRLSTLKHCDRIYFMREGRIVDVGTFDELCGREPDFAQLVALAQISSENLPGR